MIDLAWLVIECGKCHRLVESVEIRRDMRTEEEALIIRCHGDIYESRHKAAAEMPARRVHAKVFNELPKQDRAPPHRSDNGITSHPTSMEGIEALRLACEKCGAILEDYLFSPAGRVRCEIEESMRLEMERHQAANCSLPTSGARSRGWKAQGAP